MLLRGLESFYISGAVAPSTVPGRPKYSHQCTPRRSSYAHLENTRATILRTRLENAFRILSMLFGPSLRTNVDTQLLSGG